MDIKDLENRFKYHKPKNEEIAEHHSRVRVLCSTLAEELNEFIPEGREKSLAITHLEEVMFWTNAGIARNG